MNSKKELSSNFHSSFLSDSTNVSKGKSISPYNPMSQFLNYKKMTKKMGDDMLNSSEFDSDMILVIYDSSSIERQSDSENEDSLSYLKKYDESWIRVI